MTSNRPSPRLHSESVFIYKFTMMYHEFKFNASILVTYSMTGGDSNGIYRDHVPLSPYF